MQESDPKNRTILETAAKHFARSGFGSARMDEIALDAEVNKATIYYRIGDKEALYERVYASILDSLIEEIELRCTTLNDPEESLKVFIQTIAEMCKSNPYMSQIVLREVAAQGQHLSDATLKKMNTVRIFLADILNKGIRTGQFRKVNPFMIHMLIIGFINFYAAGKPITEKISDLNNTDQTLSIPTLDQAAIELTDLILNSIKLSR